MPRDAFLIVGRWLVNPDAIDAIGPAEHDEREAVVILRSGVRLIFDRDETIQIWRELGGDDGWINNG